MDVCCTIESSGACKDIERGPLSSLSWLMCLLACIYIKKKVQRVVCMNGVNLMERVLVALSTSAADNNTPPDCEKDHGLVQIAVHILGQTALSFKMS